MKPALLNLVRAAWRQKRVQTDPEVSVLLDALAEGDAPRAAEVAESTGGRVALDANLRDGRHTAVAWGVGPTHFRYPGESDDELRSRIIHDSSTRALAFLDVEIDHAGEDVGNRDALFSLLPARVEREGIVSHFDIYDDVGALVYRHVSTKFSGAHVRAGDEIGIAQVRAARRELIRTQVESAYRRGFGENVDLRPGTALGVMVDVYTEQIIHYAAQLRGSIDRVAVEGKIEV